VLAIRQRSCLRHSPTLRPWIAAMRLRPTWRDVGARCSHAVTVNRRAEVTRTATREIQSQHRGRTFLSQAGPQVWMELFKLSITFGLVVVDLPSETKKATHLGRPLPAVVSC